MGLGLFFQTIKIIAERGDRKAMGLVGGCWGWGANRNKGFKRIQQRERVLSDVHLFTGQGSAFRPKTWAMSIRFGPENIYPEFNSLISICKKSGCPKLFYLILMDCLVFFSFFKANVNNTNLVPQIALK